MNQTAERLSLHKFHRVAAFAKVIHRSDGRVLAHYFDLWDF
jgi:hypothetical protein